MNPGYIECAVKAEAIMFRKFDTLSEVVAHSPDSYAQYFEGTSSKFCSGNFLEISNGLPAGTVFMLHGEFLINGVKRGRRDLEHLEIEAPLNEKDVHDIIEYVNNYGTSGIFEYEDREAAREMGLTYEEYTGIEVVTDFDDDFDDYCA
jgi:hypothetical protein